MLKLSKHFTLNEFTYPVCIPSTTFSIDSKAACLISGWGRTHGGIDDSKLQYATVPIRSDENCPNNKGIICAAYAEGGIDTCAVSFIVNFFCYSCLGRFRVATDLFSWRQLDCCRSYLDGATFLRNEKRRFRICRGQILQKLDREHRSTLWW